MLRTLLAGRTRTALLVASGLATGAGLSYLARRPRVSPSLEAAAPPAPRAAPTMARDQTVLSTLPPFQLTFAVPMHCQACVDALRAAVGAVPGVADLAISLAAQTLTTTGTAAPSAVRAAVVATGRDAILRGSGSPQYLSAVAILETYDGDGGGGGAEGRGTSGSPVRGLARLVQVAPRATAVDVGLAGLGAGRWAVSVRRSGDVSRGAASVGAVWDGGGGGGADATEPDAADARGWVGEVAVGADAAGAAVLVVPFGVDEVLGRAMLAERIRDEAKDRAAAGAAAAPTPVMGVIARSAGAWENDKTVCSCSGKTVWEEREEQRARGML